VMPLEREGEESSEAGCDASRKRRRREFRSRV
jgi:hypothetical protein